ncbi:breast cancer type 2 susceptibility protein [Solea senegalensis]|uniref:Breast cancer type 2 susceptibility protein n=1 Tax=Solea senegalensis TaxID=28829 RepID=A0AAV6Q154_SOLSE|nr:breast cancer type 2 susceptibility protein isoform X1 [Solea senegalensis]KAG7480213.1 breast cancer type 2 susceptibility protein [Solea senegalensis]
MVCSVRTCKDYTTSPGMDLPSKNMYDEFKDEIWKELGPLDPDWFNVLTVQASTVEDNVSDELCANQEAHFKAPLDKTAPDSQLFSTPKAFRHSRVGSPETEAEQSFTAEEKEILPWKETQSPHLFRMAKERVAEAKYGGICPQSQDGYDLLHRMPKSPVNYAKKIAETLGAQVDSDISWTSSLNTPPAVPSTLILSKPDESPCPVSVSAADKNVVFVRKLFPSLSNSSRVVAASSKNSDISVQRGGLISPESPRVWRQKLPDAIEDSDVRRTVANVLDGAENVLSIFFSNSGSALRKVKTDRVQRKQIVLTKEQGCIFTGDSNSNSDVVTEQRTDDQDLEKLSSPPPLPSRDIRTTQWSPLSLSEIPPWTTDASCCEVENNVLTERLQRDSSLLAGTTLKSPHSGFIKKKRKFIYTVDASKTQDEGREIPSQIIDTSALVPDSGNDESVKLLVNDGDENETQKLPLSVKSKLQDLDMSQLCRDFAQDFSQMLDADKVSLASEDNPQNGFSASACLTAMRQAKEKARRANLHHDCDAVSHGKLGPATDESYSVNEGTISDSGFQSAVADVSHLTTTLPSTENCVQTQQFTNRRNGKPLDDIEREAETDVKLPSATEENQTLENGEPGGPSCAEETDYTLCQVGDGFKTASNKSIRISSLHLERAKRLFEENEAEKTLRDQPATGGEIIGIGNGPAKNTISNSNQAPSSSIENTADISCQLTASQKADVTELCTLLEEADSQFEFTQFKMTKPQQQDNTTSLNKVDKELDPDFLLGIDFDESFSVDAEKHTTKTAMTEKTASFMDAETSGEVLKVTSKSFGRNKNAAVASSSSEHISEGGSGVSSAKPQNLNKSHIQENNNPLMPATGFRTATGNILRVSRKCMSKARALFADLDGDLTDHKSTDEHRGKVDAKTEESWVTSVAKGLRNGFQTASGKGVSISAKAMQEADALFKDCNISHNNTALSVKLKTNMVQSPSFSSNARKHLEPKSIQEIKDVVVDNVESQSFDFKDAPAVTSAVSSHVNLPLTTQHLSSPSCTTSKSCGSSANNQSSSGGGFCTASGKKVSVSANALKKAECLLNEIHVLDSVKEHLTQKGDALKTGKPTDHALQNGGFQMASGKGVVVSSAALQKAKSLLSESEAVDDKVIVKANHYKKPVHGLSSRNNGFLAVGGKPMAISSEALQKAKALFSDIAVSEEVLKVSEPRKSSKNLNLSLTTKSFSSPSSTVSKNYISSANNQSSSGGGFCTASGKKVAVSAHALKKAECLLSEVHKPEEMKEHPTQRVDALKTGNVTDQTLQNGGFQTASGKGVVISPAALQKAKSLLSESEAVDDKVNHYKKPVHGLSSRNNGSLAAGDVTVSVETLKVSDTRRSGKNRHLTSTTKAFSSPSCSTSKNYGSSDNNQSGSGGGFCTASGKKVSVTNDALKKAECLLNDVHNTPEDKKKCIQREDCLKAIGNNADHTRAATLQNGGFQTASGKGVVVSSAALQKAKSLLSECEAFEDKICVKPNNSGFLAASGKHVTFPSSEALNKAKALFSDITLSEETRKVPDTKKCSEEQNGARVCVSRKNLLTAADVVEELDDDDSIAMQEADAFFKDCNKECEESVARGKKTSKQKHDEMLSNTSEGHGSASSEFEKGLVVKRKNVTRHNDVESHKGALTKAADSTDGNSYSAFSDFGNSGGFCTASGKKVSVSDEAMTKAKSLLNDSAAFKDTNERMPPKEDNLPPQNPDEGVAFSFDAQKKAKSQCSEAESKINIKSTRSRIPVSCSTPVNGGFLAASGKPVAFSSESLQRAKAVFNDIDFCSKTPSISDTKRRSHVYDQTTNTAGNLTCGFLTAGGAKVHVSQTNMLKAKTLFKDVAEEESRRSNSDPTPTHESDVRRNNFNLTTVRDEQETRHSVPRVVKSFQPLQETDHENETLQDSRMHNCISNREKALADESELKEGKREETFTSPWVGNPHAEEMGNVSRSEVNHTSSSEGPRFKRTEETSVIILDLGGCTKTQQEFLAQEALDCTKALLEDESLAGKILLPTLEGERLQDNPGTNPRSVEGQRRRGKRVGEDADMTVQPPLKRQLLEEFDRTVDEPTLQPQKTCPNSVIKDRRVFKYSVSHHPNITGPHGSEKHYVERRQSIAGRGTSAHSKIPTFVPPFLKNAKTETRRNTVLNVGAKTPSAFVPPFKKQRTVVQESSSRPHDEKDIHLRLFGPPSNSNGLAPPAKKPQSGADVSGDKGEEDVKTMTFPDTTDNPTMNSPADCVSDESAAEEVFSRSQDMFLNLESVEMARDMQDMRIRKKKRQTIRPLPGSLFLAKTSGVSRVPLKAAVNGKPPVRCSPKQLYECGVHQHVCEISSENAEMFRFSLKQFLNMEVFTEHGGVQLADGGWLVPSNDGTAGKQEFYRALCDTPGVDPKLMSEEWVFNHYRWIVWKQASMERSFPETMGGLRLTPEQVLLQLKYRYDVEIDHSRRPALRKIMERDDTAAKTLLLCVCGVVSSGRSPNEQSHSDAKAPQGSDAKVENSSAVVWLTDGWYSVKAQLDEPLTAMLHKGRLAVGGKLIVYGAQLVGSQDACSPLEAPESLMLKICANSTRPARWDTKLGFHKDPRPFLLPLSSLFSNGGPVGCVDITVLRSYPVQWMERKPDGGVVFRSVRAEEKEARRYSKHKQKAMEILFAKIQSEFEKEQIGNDKPQRRRRTMSRQDIVSLQDGEELHEAVGDDPAYFEAHLSERQLATLQTYRRSLMEKQQAELQDRYRRAVDAESSDGGCPNRDVTPVWRLCVADSMDQRARAYQLNLWRPPSDLQSMLKEGCRYRVYNVTTSDGKRRSGVETVHLTGTKKTQFQDLQASREWLSTHFQPRVSTNFVELQDIEYQPLCGEVDLAGYIISIIDEQGSTPAFYLADGSLNFVKVRSFSSFAHSGLEDVVRLRVLLALSNLQLRGQSTHPSPVVYAGDLTVFSTNPKEAHLQESLCQLRNLVQAQENFFQAAEEKLSLLIKSDDVVSAVSSPALLHPRTPVVTTDGRQDARTSQPIRSLGSVTPMSTNPPAASSSTENKKDPKSLKRRRALDYLSRIPSPPSLSCLSSAASPCVKKTFNPPRRSATPGTLTTPARKPAPPLPLAEDEWVNDEELAMIDTQNLQVGNSL